MKILIVSHSVQLGGAQNMLLSLARGLSTFAEIIVSVPKDHGYVVDRLIDYRIPFCLHSRMPLADLVISNTQAVMDGVEWAKKNGIAHVWYIHEIYAECDHIDGNVIAISNTVKSHLQAKNIPSTVIYSGIAVPPAGKRKRNKVVLSVGGVCKRKDQMTMIHAASEVLAELPEVAFVNFGGFWEDDYFQQLRKERKRLGLGDSFVFHNVLRDLSTPYSESSVFATSPVLEPFGLAILEAMSYSLPVVTTKSGGPEEIITDGKDGYLVDCGNPRAIAARIIELLQDEKKADAMGIAAHDTVENKFPYDRYIEEFIRYIGAITPT